MNRRILVIDPLPPAVRTTRGEATPIELSTFLMWVEFLPAYFLCSSFKRFRSA
jgi:hypothetical protein